EAAGDLAGPERAARPRGERGLVFRHLRDVVPGADIVQPRARPRPQKGRAVAAGGCRSDATLIRRERERCPPKTSRRRAAISCYWSVLSPSSLQASSR